MMSVDATVSPKPAEVTNESHSLTYSGAEVRVLNTRPVSAPRGRIVVVHGYGEHAGRYDRFAHALAREGVAVTTADLPGHGCSAEAPGELGDFEALDELLLKVCDASLRWNGPTPLAILGHSLGGLIASGFIARNPRIGRALILSAPVLGRWSAIEAFEEVEEIPPSMVRARHLSSVPTFAESYETDPLIYRGPLHRSTLSSAKKQLLQLASSRPFAGRRVLWLHGSDDRIVPLPDVLSALADLGVTDLTARVFDGARHDVLNDHSCEEATAMIGEFVRLPHTTNHAPKIGDLR